MRIRGLATLLLLSACTGDPSGIRPGDVAMSVAVDADAPPEHNVEVRVENRGEQAVYVMDYCGDIVTPRFQRRTGGGWVDAPYGPVPCLAMLTPPIEVAPGAAVVRSLLIDEPGRYRSIVRLRPRENDAITTVREEFTVGS
jgi:hypothetical protein